MRIKKKHFKKQIKYQSMYNLVNQFHKLLLYIRISKVIKLEGQVHWKFQVETTIRLMMENSHL
jgi:poly(A) polymerase Pap1